MLHKGKFIFDGTPEDILRCKDPRVRCFVEGRCTEEDMQSLRIQDEL
jgi:ABC-type transporter Mla maintaining outer membrane lipid asymmetry ATPase subunit MlaF